MVAAANVRLPVSQLVKHLAQLATRVVSKRINSQVQFVSRV